MAPSVQIGTAGYSYKDWKGPFYPEDCKPGDMLGVYASRFATTELNFTYYRQPETRQLARMAATAGAQNEAFTFSIKAFRGLTHEITPAWEDEAQRFRDAVQTLADTGRLGAVLVQFPYAFHYTVQNRQHMDRLLRRLEGLPLACEFRSREWLGDRVYEGLRARNVALVAVDEPQLRGLLPPVAVPTADIGYVRLHGRNQNNWWQGDNASRYDYLYSEDELGEWLPRIETICESARTVFVYFNNHWRGQAAENAEQFRRLIVDTRDAPQTEGG